MSVGLSGCHVCCQMCIAHEPYQASLFFVSCSAGTDPSPFAMAKKQQNLKDLWLSATPGRLSPWQQAKALALREVNMELHGGKVHRSWICARLTRGGRWTRHAAERGWAGGRGEGGVKCGSWQRAACWQPAAARRPASDWRLTAGRQPVASRWQGRRLTCTQTMSNKLGGIVPGLIRPGKVFS